MPAKVTIAGWEAWCPQCGDGSGCTGKYYAQIWAKSHNERMHRRSRREAAR